MTTTTLLKSLLVGALLASGSTPAADNTIQVVMEQGRPTAQFNIGDSRCVLRDDQIRCAPVNR